MRIVVAMSGGVDSSVAAALLAEQGHDVIGLSMRLYPSTSLGAGPSTGSEQAAGADERFGGCCTLDDLNDARRVAAVIGFPHYIVNFERQVVAEAQRGAGQGPVLLSVLADAGSAGTGGLPGRPPRQARRARAGPSSWSRRRRQARQPGNLLHP